MRRSLLLLVLTLCGSGCTASSNGSQRETAELALQRETAELVARAARLATDGRHQEAMQLVEQVSFIDAANDEARRLRTSLQAAMPDSPNVAARTHDWHRPWDREELEAWRGTQSREMRRQWLRQH